MYLNIIILPLFSSLITGFLGNLIGISSVFIISIGTLFSIVLISLFIFYEIVLCNSICVIKLFTWFSCGVLEIKWGFLFDTLSASMLVVVTVISLLVHIFSVNYMANDAHIIRFMSYLTLFTFFMIILVTANNLPQMFLGWEGVGLASYLLINFWYTRIQANKAAIKAIIINRIGDFSLILGIAAIFYLFGSLDYYLIFSISHYLYLDNIKILIFDINGISLITFLLFIGAVGKSAQLGLHVWLPDAMEGPTPVSALIHAATMVTAGVFLLIRFSPIIEFSNNILIIITIWGAITAFFAATVGLVQNDIKRVIAYSTCSQLGYMVFACGLSNYSISFFHLMNHAFFKALLFLSAGAIIHSLADEQDIRRMGGLIKILPFFYILFLIGSLSLMGFPFLTGFYSKDIILELAYGKYSISATFAYWLGIFSASFTAFYSIRLIFFVFIDYTTNMLFINYKNIDKNLSIFLKVPLIILAIGSIFIGFIAKDLFIGLGTNAWSNTLFYLPNNNFFLNAEFIPNNIKIRPLFFSFFGVFFTIYLYNKNNILSLKNNNNFYYNFLIYKWYFDLLYYYFINKPLLIFGYEGSFKIIDRGFFEIIGPLGLLKIYEFIKKILLKKNKEGNFMYFILNIFYIFCIFLFFSSFFIFSNIFEIKFLVIFIFLNFLLYNFYKIIFNKL